MKANVPGMFEGTYMTTSQAIPPTTRPLRYRGRDFMETRGFWEVEGDFMGGPFVSNSMVDTVNNRLVTAFAYVYGGKNDKKTLLWQLEAMLSTFNIHYDVEN